MRSDAVATVWRQRAGGQARRQDPGMRSSREATSGRSLQWLSKRPHSAADAKATLLPVRSTPHHNVLTPPRRRVATMRRIFYGLINLAKALTAGAYARRRVVLLLANGKQKLTISQSLPHNITDHNPCGPHVCFLPSIDLRVCMFCAPRWCGCRRTRFAVRFPAMSRARPRVPLTWCRSWIVAGAATQTQSSAEVVRDAFEAVDHAVANLRLEVEDFLAKVAV
jgi:hypothetical protein